MKPNSKFRGLVLAGGHSSRMGTDKASLPHPDGRTLARRTCDLLIEAGCESVVLSLRHDQALPDGFSGFEELTIVRDPEGPGAGPMAGIVGGMCLAPDSNWLVLACDLPRLDAATLSNLVSAVGPDEKFLAYCSESDGLPEPLCAYYSSAALPVLEKALADDMRCPRKVLIRNDCRLLAPVSPGALANANTPQDWATAILT